MAEPDAPPRPLAIRYVATLRAGELLGFTPDWRPVILHPHRNPLTVEQNTNWPETKEPEHD